MSICRRRVWPQRPLSRGLARGCSLDVKGRENNYLSMFQIISSDSWEMQPQPVKAIEAYRDELRSCRWSATCLGEGGCTGNYILQFWREELRQCTLSLHNNNGVTLHNMRAYAYAAVHCIIKSRIDSGMQIICMIHNPPTVLDQTFQQLTALNSCAVCSHAGASVCIPLLFHRGVKGAPLCVVSLASLRRTCDKSNPSRHSPAPGAISSFKPHKAETSEACQVLDNNACVWIALGLAWLNTFVRPVWVFTVQQEIKLTLQICEADRKSHAARNPHCYLISCQFVTCKIPGRGTSRKVWQAKRE